MALGNISSALIVGLGLIGGSIALRLQECGLKVRGVTRSKGTLDAALERDAISGGSLVLDDEVGKADLIILAAPTRASIALITEVDHLARRGVILTDVCSSKRLIVGEMNTGVNRTRAVGGHPMAGRENGGIQNADAGLFEDAVWALSNTSTTDKEAANVCEKLVALCGARSLWVDPVEHDEAVAFVSHLPLLTSAALLLAAKEHAPRLAWSLASSGFRDSTRLASGPPEMGADLLITNAEGIRRASREFSETLEKIASMLEAGDVARLEGILRIATEQRAAIYGRRDCTV